MRKKIALLLSIVMIIASMPITAFAANANRVYAVMEDREFIKVDEHFDIPSRRDAKLIDGNTVTDLRINSVNKHCSNFGLPLKDKTKLENVTVNKPIVDKNLLKDFTNVKNVTLSSRVESIKSTAFNCTSVEEITIPISVSSIATDAFLNMPKLKAITNNTGRAFDVIVGGVPYTLNPNAKTEFGLRLEQNQFIVDKKDNSATLNLKAIGNGNENVTFSTEGIIPDGLTLSESGVLTFTTMPNDYIELSIKLTTPSKTEVVPISIEFYDSSVKSGLFPYEKGIENDPYSYDAPEGTFGDDVITPYEPYTFKISGNYGEIQECRVRQKIDGRYSGVDVYAFGNEVTIFSELTSGEDLEIRMNVFDSEDVIKDPNNSTQITSTPFSATGIIDETDLRVPLDYFGGTVFGDVYVVPFESEDVVSVKINDISKYTSLELGIIYEGIDAYGDYVMDYMTYDNNNFDGTGESQVIYNFPEMQKGTYYIVVTQGDNKCLGNSYNIEIDKFNQYADFPSQVTVDEKQLDFVLNSDSVTDANGKYSWNSATKTLTLEDGFFLRLQENSNRDPAIILPGDATVVVKGNAGIDAHDDAIWFENPERTLESKIILEKGANLNIYSYCDAINFESKKLDIIGTPDENGNLPKFNYLTNDDGIESVLDQNIAGIENIATLNIENVELDISTAGPNIHLLNGIAKLDNCKGRIHSEYEESINARALYTTLNGNDWHYVAPDGQIGVEINNSDLILETGYYGCEGIDTETGGVKITNSKLKIYSYDDDGIYIDDNGDLNIDNSDLKINAGYHGFSVYEDKINISNSKLAIYAYDGIIKAGGGLNIDGIYEIFDNNNNLVYTGALQDLVVFDGDDYYLELKDNEGNNINLCGMIKTSGNAIEIGDTKVSASKDSYVQGENIEIVIDAPKTEGNEMAKAVSWEVVGTDLKGNLDKDAKGISIPTDSLAPGEYVVKIAIAKLRQLPNGAWQYVTDADGNDEMTYKTVTINVLSKAELEQEQGKTDVKSPETGAELGLAFGGVLMLGLSLSVMTITSRKKGQINSIYNK